MGFACFGVQHGDDDEAEDARDAGDGVGGEGGKAGKEMYLIKWKNLSYLHNSWEMASDLQVT